MKLDLLLFSILVSAGIMEVYLRAVEVDDLQYELNEMNLRAPDPVLHHALVPNVSTEIMWGYKICKYKTNDLGFRDLENRRVPKTYSGDKRVLILGDSFAECLGVNYEHSFVTALESKLKNAGKEVSFLNSGVVSYSPGLQKRVLKNMMNMGYEFDSVLLLLDISDVEDESTDERTGYGNMITDDELAEIRGERRVKKDSINCAMEKDHQFRVALPRVVGCLSLSSKGWLSRVCVMRSRRPPSSMNACSNCRICWSSR